ncbi:hypothetical protein [Marinobacter sp.]|uniref:hypothetical protein n=1 Tax=Marinobacter sp. TaxID=50741 RepID=UPI0019FF9332|nr:hypothetical protein [Marinobacter sp.]MBE0487003.1 hypothetical protein [Marinobacter sp.]
MKGPDNNTHWWLGVAELAAHGIQHGAEKLKRVHLSIADESFRVLEAIPVTRSASRFVRVCHHSIARVSYGSVSLAGRVVAEGAASAAVEFGPG